MQNREKVMIWPILYFQAQWPSKSYDFELGIRLVKADKTLLQETTDCGVDNNCWLSNIEGADNMLNNTEWFLCMQPPEVTEHIPISEIGMSFADGIQQSIIESFLMCLQLVRSTPAICPFKFPAEIQGDSIDEVDTSNDFCGIHSEEPSICFPETFELGDLQLLSFLWSLLIKLRKLDLWSELINKEEFFAACDKKASEDATEKLLDLFMKHKYYTDVSEEERKKAREQWIASIQEAKSNGGLEIWKLFYKDSFSDVFIEKQDEVFSNRTRIGRALNLFYEGLHLPILHSFLSMCLVLETLFTIGKGETVYKLAVRSAKIIGSDVNMEKRKELYQKVKKVYDERSGIVHGEKLIEEKNTEIIKDAFVLARSSLQRILLNNELLELYSHPGTTDKKLKGKRKGLIKNEAFQSLSDYFLKIDLSM